MHAVLVAFVCAIIGRAAMVQIWQHDHWRTLARRHQVANTRLPASRGNIEDAAGVPVAFSRELMRLAVAKNEVRDVTALGKAMRAAGIPASEVRRATDRRRGYVELRGSYLPARVASLGRHYGVKVTRVADREYVPSAGARQVLGLVGPKGRGIAGIEAVFDSLLQGESVTARLVKGKGGHLFESPEMLGTPIGRGHTVRLTINGVLQDICDDALLDAVRRLRADGGDIVVIQPRTGEILCLSGRRPGNAFGGATAIIEPYEPGSTLKSFLAARLLEEKKATPDDVVETFNGRWELHGRVISDVHRAPRMSLRDVIRFSSNIGIIQFASRLDDGDVYELYRDLGFGTQTGIPYPAEASGILREPRRWSAQSRASLAMGYEVSVTPLQLALAYTTLANRGELVAPALVKEVRNAEGAVVWRHRPQMLRRVFTPDAVRELMPLLESVVDSGTATDAGLESFPLAGKSGTARRALNGTYRTMTYTSSFVGLFPAGDPQYVVLAKIDNPREESIYGGKVAAPVARAVIQGALAARDASLDWRELAPQQRELVRAPGAAESVVAQGQIVSPEPASSPEPAEPLPASSRTFHLDRPEAKRRETVPSVTVPETRGVSLRAAARRLHEAGLGVRVGGQGGGSSPAAGSVVKRGTVVTVARP